MKHSISNRLGVALVVGVAVSAIVLSQVAFAQRAGGSDGVAELIGRSRIRPDDARFQPAAMMFIGSATGGAGSGRFRGTLIFTRTVMTDWIDRYVVYTPRDSARGEQPRPLTPAETALLEELFTSDLSRAKVEVSDTGISGSVSPRDLRMKSGDMTAKARSRAEMKARWYAEAAKGLSSP